MDGHGSNEVAEFVRDTFPVYLKESEAFKSKDYEKALTEACVKVDDFLRSPEGIPTLLKYTNAYSASKELPQKIRNNSLNEEVGCTACIVLITQDRIICANLGDSRCVLGYEEGEKIVAKPLSTDHKPNLPSEKQRIEKEGGFVEDNRVDGGLNLGRSLGDLKYKLNIKVGPGEQKVSCVPEIKTFQIDNHCKFLIVACDGIWDCKTSEHAVEFFTIPIKKRQYPITTIVGNLLDNIIAP